MQSGSLVANSVLPIAAVVASRPNRHAIIRRLVTNYDATHAYWPLWVAAESFSFGDMVTLYRGSPDPVRTSVARSFGVESKVFGSWLGALQALRNICAHYARLWNRQLGVQPMLPDKLPGWRDPRVGRTGRPFVLFTILQHLMRRLCPRSGWPDRLGALFDRSSHVPLEHMGIVPGWNTHPIWAPAPA